ncbi:MAG: hypothetical protein M1839_002467 [Geoglossum umbratile]|nr:MAG: hypothetical protein M1839_002467 [Geoglossum umbratile]
MGSTEEYKSLAALASLSKRTVTQLIDLMDGPLVKPHFDVFYTNWLKPKRKGIAGTRARSVSQNGPSLQTVIHHIAAGERNGNQKYTSSFSDRTNWKDADHYAELLERLYQDNKKNRSGLFFGTSVANKDDAYKLLWQIIRRLVDTSRATSHVPFSSAKSHTKQHIANPIVVLWKNVDDRTNGWYHEENQPKEAIFRARDPMEYSSLGDFRQAIVQYFRLEIPKLEIGKLYRVAYADTKVVTSPITEELWEHIKAMKRGEFFQVTIFLETRPQLHGDDRSCDNRENNGGEIDDNLDLHNPNPISELFLSNAELRGPIDSSYLAMIQERESDGITMEDRFGKYTNLLSIATMTNGTVLGDVAMQRDGNDEDVSVEISNESSLAWALELSQAKEVVPDTQSAAALGARLFGEITEEEAKDFRDREKWTDNTKFQRDNLVESCTLLGIENQGLLKIDGMSPT